MECLKCGHIWEPRVDKPLECPSCRQRKYDKPRVFTSRTPINIVPEKKDEQPQPTKQKKVVRFN